MSLHTPIKLSASMTWYNHTLDVYHSSSLVNDLPMGIYLFQLGGFTELKTT